MTGISKEAAISGLSLRHAPSDRENAIEDFDHFHFTGIGLQAVGFIRGQSVQAMARQPEAAGMVRTTMFLGIAFTEALALIGFVLFFLA